MRLKGLPGFLQTKNRKASTRTFAATRASRFLNYRWSIRWLVGVSTIYGFFAFYDMYSYLPWHHKTAKALATTLEAHLGLWLATLEIRGRWRFPVAMLLVPSAVGVYFLFWHGSFITGIAAPLLLSSMLYRVLRGRRRDPESV